MKFKIDTNPSYTRILPEGEALNATMAARLVARCQELQAAVAQNFIIDFAALPDAEARAPQDVFGVLTSLHEALYSAGSSLVFTGIGPLLLAQLKGEALHHLLNITPTLPEAVDMVNMEILERDLFNEEP